MKYRVLIVIGITLGVLMLGVGIWLTLKTAETYRLGILLSRDTEIGPDWIEIQPSGTLSVEKEVQYVAVDVAPPFDAWKANGITAPSGQLVNPEIKVISVDGNEYEMTYYGADSVAGFPNGHVYADFANGRLKKGEKIQKLMIRSDTPIPVKEIRWSGFDWKDRK